MESCTLDVVLLESTDMTDFMNFSFSGKAGDFSWVMAEAWRVSNPEIIEGIDPQTLSWETKPPRKLFVGYWSLKPWVRMQSETFDCISNSLHIFEFVCVDPMCHLEFQQDSRIALYMTQRQSKIDPSKSLRWMFCTLIKYEHGRTSREQ
ncbi:hypothetical protein B0H13DRAFT_2040609 [Mycena leptocephala]|nr:hypothetical protein B0H13DRAFT_2040609 [Mycena leptocephala]